MNRKTARNADNAQLIRMEKAQRLHRTGEKRAQKEKQGRWPYQAAYNTMIRLEMIRRGIFDAKESFG